MVVLSLNLKNISPVIIFVKLWGFEYCHFGQFWTSFALLTRTSRSKLIKRSLIALIDLILGAKSITLCFI